MSIRISGDGFLWPNGIVPFEIDTVDFPPNASGDSLIRAAIAEWNTRTNITFIPRQNESDYVVFRMGDEENALDSAVGKRGGRQFVNGASLGFTTASVIHEIGHAIGLWHEQSRSDRDQFVNINMGSVLDKKEHNFDKHDSDGIDLGAYDYFSIMHYGRKLFTKNPMVDTVVPVSWFGHETQAAGCAAADIDRSGIADDIVLFHIDNPGGANQAFYRVIFGLKANGTDKSMSRLFAIPGWIGDETQGGGIAIADISGNGLPDLLVFWIDHAQGGNQGYYRIGWDMDKDGSIGRWSETWKVEGWFGAENSGAGVSLVKLNDGGRWDLVIYHVDNPGGSNTGYYRVGFDLDVNGKAGAWLPPTPVPGWLGNDTAAAGIAIGTVSGVRNTIIIFHIDDPAGENRGYLRFSQLRRDGSVSGWTSPLPIPGWFGNDNQEGDICLVDFGSGPTLLAFHIDNPAGDNRGYLRIGTNLTNTGNQLTWGNIIPVHNFGANAIDVIGNQTALSNGDISAVNSMYPTKTVFGPVVRDGGWFGDDTQGADVALADINGNGRQDLCIFFVDNPAGANMGYYRIGWNLDANGLVTGNYTPAIPIPGWWGNDTAAAGIALADISGNGQLDIVVMHVDDPAGANKGYYRVGWNLDASGNVTGGWTPPIPIPGWWGNETTDGGIAIMDISGSGRPDLVVFHVDNPGGANTGYYRIGKDLSTAGIAASWTMPAPVPGWFGFETDGAGVAVKDLNGNGKPDLVIFHIDNPNGANQGFYRIAKDLDRNGNPTGGWTRVIPIAGWWGNENSGGGIAIADINGDGTQDFLAFHIDNPSGANHGFHRTLFTPLQN